MAMGLPTLAGLAAEHRQADQQHPGTAAISVTGTEPW